MQYRLHCLGSCMGRRLCSHAIEVTLFGLLYGKEAVQ